MACQRDAANIWKMEDTDVDAIFDEHRVFIETLDNVNNKVLFDFLIQLWISF